MLVPDGTADVSRAVGSAAVPTGLIAFIRPIPALKRRAIVRLSLRDSVPSGQCPFGTKAEDMIRPAPLNFTGFTEFLHSSVRTGNCKRLEHIPAARPSDTAALRRSFLDARPTHQLHL